MEDNDIDIEHPACYVDQSIRSMQNKLKSKRQKLSQVRGLDRIENNKYLTNMENAGNLYSFKNSGFTTRSKQYSDDSNTDDLKTDQTNHDIEERKNNE